MYTLPPGLTKDEILTHYGTSRDKLKPGASYWVVSKEEAQNMGDPHRVGYLHVVEPHPLYISLTHYIPPPQIAAVHEDYTALMCYYQRKIEKLERIPRWIRWLFNAL
jgi:hypothetical protein